MAGVTDAPATGLVDLGDYSDDLLHGQRALPCLTTTVEMHRRLRGFGRVANSFVQGAFDLDRQPPGRELDLRVAAPGRELTDMANDLGKLVEVLDSGVAYRCPVPHLAKPEHRRAIVDIVGPVGREVPPRKLAVSASRPCSWGVF